MANTEFKIIFNGVAIALMLAGLISSIIGISTIYWFTLTYEDPRYGTMNYREGLWRICFTAEDYEPPETACDYFAMSDLYAWSHAFRALMIISLIPSIVAFCLIFAACYQDNRLIPLIASGVAVINEVILQAIGVLLFYFKMDPADDGGSFGWSFYVCCGSTVVLFVASILLFIHAVAVYRSKRREYQRIIN